MKDWLNWGRTIDTSGSMLSNSVAIGDNKVQKHQGARISQSSKVIIIIIIIIIIIAVDMLIILPFDMNLTI